MHHHMQASLVGSAGATLTADPALDGLVCPKCLGEQLHSATNGYSSCWCARCGAHIALRARVNASPGSGLEVAVAGLRTHRSH